MMIRPMCFDIEPPVTLPADTGPQSDPAACWNALLCEFHRYQTFSSLATIFTKEKWAIRAVYDDVVPEGISRDDVAHVARLARLDLTDEELDRFAGQLAAVLDHAGDVASLDTAGVEPTAHPLPLANVLRDDEVAPSLDRDEVLAQAPEAEDDRFRVPRILTEGA